MVSSSLQVKSIGMSASNYVLPTRPTHALSFIFLTTLDQHGVCENMFGQMYDELLLFLQTQTQQWVFRDVRRKAVYYADYSDLAT